MNKLTNKDIKQVIQEANEEQKDIMNNEEKALRKGIRAMLSKKGQNLLKLYKNIISNLKKK